MAQFLNQGQNLLAMAVNGDISLYDLRFPNKAVKIFQGNQNDFKILPWALNRRSESHFAAVGKDEKVRIWDVWNEDSSPIFEKEISNVQGIAFDPSSNLSLCIATRNGVKSLEIF